MRNKSKKIIILLITSITIFLCIGGCKEKNEEKDVSTNIETQENNELVDRAEDIADNVVELIGIDDATAIIYEKKAVIVIELADGVEFDNNMIQMIKSIAMEGDEKIKDAIVIADKKIFDIIDEIEQSLIKGDNIKNHKTKIDNIIKKVNN